mmetsp:Transcript_7499/g.15616  ORF Transcript_7499/g.15616 Transcript_7499/m.15616 type:complete len:362 (+) Transcript_7499:52-1137(+)
MSTVPDSLPPLNDVDADPTTEMEVDLPPASPDSNLNGGLSTPMSPTPPSGPQPRSSPRPKPPPGTVDESAKTVYLIRHGVSRHNHHNVNLESPVLLDASLDIVGVHQAVALGMRYRNAIGDAIVNPPPKRSAAPYIPAEIELVCVSPLTRCLETAHHAFAIGAPKSPKETGAIATAEDLAKEKKKKHVPSEKGKRAPVPMMHPNPPPPFVCHDALREATGVNYPDKRRSKSAIKAAFPTVDFSNVLDEDDLLWKPNKRESLRELNVRISSFFDWLSSRPEKVIAVVTHGVWIEECLRRNVPSTLRGGIRVMNAEVYQCECVGHVREEGPMEAHGLIMKKAFLVDKLSKPDESERGVKIGGH